MTVKPLSISRSQHVMIDNSNICNNNYTWSCLNIVNCIARKNHTYTEQQYSDMFSPEDHFSNLH